MTLIGFDNFQWIQNRKWDYLGDAVSERLITELAIREPLVTKPHLKELEVRLSPSLNAEEDARNIQNLDRSVTSGERFGMPEKSPRVTRPVLLRIPFHQGNGFRIATDIEG